MRKEIFVMISSKLYRIALLIWAFVLIDKSIIRANYSGSLNERTILCYVLLFLGGVAGVLLWSKMKEYVVMVSAKQKWTSSTTLLIKNCFAVLLICAWYVAYLCVGSVTGAYVVVFGGKDVIMLLAISFLIVGVSTMVYTRFIQK